MSARRPFRAARSGFSVGAGRLFDRAYWVTDTFRDAHWLTRHLPIAPSDLVLDVGSGSGPNLRSNVLCDKFPWDATERHGGGIRLDRPFVLGDVERLPFADKAFDFVICSHVLEHVKFPERAVAELQRVAHRGYIETPAASWEKVAGFDFHRWMVSIVDDRLVFVAKRHPIEDQQLSDWFDRLQTALHIRRYLWLRRRAAGVYTSLVWTDQIEIEVDRTEASPAAEFRAATVAAHEPRQGSACPDLPVPVRKGVAARALDRYGRHLRRRSDITQADLERLLRCPNCRADLRRENGRSYSCLHCDSEYPSDGSPFPILIPPAEVPGPRSIGSGTHHRIADTR